MSSSFSDSYDSDDLSDSYNGRSHHGFNSMIPRTSGIEQPFNSFDSDQSEEDIHESFLLAREISEDSDIYQQFLRREDGAPQPLFLTPESLETIDIPEAPNSKNEKAIIHLLDLPLLLGERRHTKDFIHSWCNITDTTSVEANRKISKYLATQYTNVDPKWYIKPEISWASKISKQRFFSKKPITQQITIYNAKFFHYIGLGLPAPECDRIYMKENSGDPNCCIFVDELKKALSPPCLMIFDCDKAGILKPFIQKNDNSWLGSSNSSLFTFFACSQNEKLNISPNLPQNFFSCILLSPDRAYAALTGVNVNYATFDKLLCMFTETIAFDSITTNNFHRLFRSNMPLPPMWRRFLLAQRLMKRIGLHCQSIPDLPDMGDHHIWNQFDYVLKCFDKTLNPLLQFSELYKNYFENVKAPPRYACAFMSSLLSIQEIKPVILEKIAIFMKQSPSNCRFMAEVLNSEYIGSFSSYRSDTGKLKNWATIISGLLLVVSKPVFLQFTLSTISFQDALKLISDKNYDEQCRILIISIFICLRSFSQQFNYLSIPEESIIELLQKIFESSPQMREWNLFFLHSTFSQFSIDPILSVQFNLLTYSLLLLYDSRKYTRIITIIILTKILSKWCDVNDNIMRFALKSAIDGSSNVRLAFLFCVARYCYLNKELCQENEPESLDYLIRNDPIKFVNDEHKPKLRQLILLLKEDPVKEIRETATQILTDPLNCGYELSHEEYGQDTYKALHLSLFCESFKESKMKQRYIDSLINGDKLELFEVFSYGNSPITTVNFDLQHNNVCFSDEDGNIFWEKNHWKIHNDFSNGGITNLIHFKKLIILAADHNGCVYIYRNGDKTQIEAFRPSLHLPSEKTIMCSIPDTYITFISQGNNEIYIWNIESLLMLSYIQIPIDSPITYLYYFNGFIYVLLQNDTICRIDINDYKNIDISEFHSPHKIIRICDHNNKLFTIDDNGNLYFWDNFHTPSLLKNIGQSYDAILHPKLPYILKIEKQVSIIRIDTNEETTIFSENHYTCSSFDGNRGLLAIGYDNGSVSIWRIPSPFSH